MEKDPLITIIVPVYQVKEYVEECVEALLAQTYHNLEILLIDDGSTDGSEAICDSYAEKYGKIRVIHQNNQGLSSARNTGLDHMRGAYVAFVDADDVVLPDFIEVMYELMGQYYADIAMCANIKGDVKQKISGRDGGEICMSSEQMLRQWHGKYKKWETVPWNKLYHRSVFESSDKGAAARFPIGKKYEDVLTSHLFVERAKRIVLTSQALYIYRTRPGSISAQTLMTRENKKENLMAQRERMRFFWKKRYWRAYFNLLVGYVLHWGWFVVRGCRREERS